MLFFLIVEASTSPPKARAGTKTQPIQFNSKPPLSVNEKIALKAKLALYTFERKKADENAYAAVKKAIDLDKKKKIRPALINKKFRSKKQLMSKREFLEKKAKKQKQHF